MAQFSETVDIKRPPEKVWKVVGQPERWFEGYLETALVRRTTRRRRRGTTTSTARA
jgi:hypothetical protein